MRINSSDIRAYEDQGYVLWPKVFSSATITLMKMEFAVLCSEESPARFLEKDGTSVRSLYGSHLDNELFRSLARHPSLLEPAQQLLGSDVYVYQSKINAKLAFGGDAWEWHQDLAYWFDQDGLPGDQIINVAIFLDDVTEFNGPMFVIPGSHKSGMLAPAAKRPQRSDGAWQTDNPEWVAGKAERLKSYLIEKEMVGKLVTQYGMESFKGPAGTVAIFHPNLVHSSTQNISPFDRAMAIMTYNSVLNLPLLPAGLRPEFMASHDHCPLVPKSDPRFGL